MRHSLTSIFRRFVRKPFWKLFIIIDFQLVFITNRITTEEQIWINHEEQYIFYNKWVVDNAAVFDISICSPQCIFYRIEYNNIYIKMRKNMHLHLDDKMHRHSPSNHRWYSDVDLTSPLMVHIISVYVYQGSWNL